MTEPQIVPNLGEADYHTDETTLSASGAKVLLGKRPPASDSDALRFGTLVHRAILEPERLGEYKVLEPSVIGVTAKGEPAANPTATTAWKNAVAECAANGLTVVNTADMDRALAMRDAAMAHPTARRIIEQATDTELSLYADHPTGARIRARLDLAGPIIGDLKATRNGDPQAFGRTAYDYGYHISAANYLDIATACGMDPQAFAFVNIEHQPTLSGEHRVSVVELSERAIDLGRREMAEACRRWLDNGQRIDLPDYGDGFSTVDLPAYAYYDTTEETAA